MADHIKDLEKLVELKGRGALSEAEFEAQKKALLGGGPKKRGVFWRFAKWGALGIIGVVITGGVLSVAMDAGQTPTCESAAVQQRVTSLLNVQTVGAFGMMGIGGAAPAFRVHGIKDAKQLHHDAESGYRACVAATRLDNGNGVTGYTIEWVDKKSGLSNVALADAIVLTAKYGESSATGSSTAKPSSHAEAPAPTPTPVAVKSHEVRTTRDGDSIIKSTTCGGAEVSVTYQSTGTFSSGVTITLLSNGKRKLYTDWSNDNFEASCVMTHSDKEYLLVNSVCGGAVCGDQNYGVIDPEATEVVYPLGEADIDAIASKLGFKEAALPFCCGDAADSAPH